ncbi:hypothetical protein B841_12956 (plasmid) [Corynebacterium maris DSM 45190]|uniref:Uncharacterized protein n=2 Tax=Corynebacterium TaxID=1716 RepID=S5TMJ8_9CORY|nr:hypothetical protein B841_12956 [Corynebacterium maris DSM 45190]
MVIYPQGKTEFFLIDHNGVMAQPIPREEIIVSTAVEESLRRFEDVDDLIPRVINFSHEDLNLSQEPKWEYYIYDVLPGHEVVFSPLKPNIDGDTY